MKTKIEETRNTLTKRRKQNKLKGKEYEQIDENKHMGGTSFVVNKDTDRLLKWKTLLHMRYYQHLGERKNIHVEYKKITDIEKRDIEERYNISNSDAQKITLTITIYHNTGRILIQGNNKKEWVSNEFIILKSIVDRAEIIEDIEECYINVYNLDNDDIKEKEEDINEMADELVGVVLKKIIEEYIPRSKIKKKDITPNDKMNKKRKRVSLEEMLVN